MQWFEFLSVLQLDLQITPTATFHVPPFHLFVLVLLTAASEEGCAFQAEVCFGEPQLPNNALIYQVFSYSVWTCCFLYLLWPLLNIDKILRISAHP